MNIEAQASDLMLQEAISATRQGNRERARDLLTRLLRTAPENPEYWLWMSAVVETEREQIYCLRSLLKLDPRNQAARRGLIILGAIEPAREAVAGDHPSARQAGLTVGPGASRMFRAIRQRARSWEPVRPGRKRSIPGWAALLAIACVAGVFLVAVGPGMVTSMRSQFGASATQTPLRIVFRPPTSTPTLAPTPVRPQSTPIRLASTPLAVLLGVTQTATPIYAATPHPDFEAYALAMNALRQGNWEQVIALMGQVAAGDPQAADPHYFIGEAHRIVARHEEAIAEYNAALRLNPSFAPAYLGRGLADLALRRPQDAAHDFDEAIRLDPNYVDAYLARAALAAGAGNYEAALADLGVAREVAPDSPLAKIRLSLVLSGLGRYAEALSASQAANSNDPTILEGYLALGTAHNGLGQFESAQRDLDLYLVYAPDDPEGWTQRGSSRNGLLSYEGAVQDFSQALQIEPARVAALHGRGEAHLALQDYEAALTDFTTALDLQPNIQGHLGRGQANLGLGKARPAIADFQAALQFEPDSIGAWLGLGRAQLLAEQYEQAVETLSQALLLPGSEAEISAIHAVRAQAYESLREFTLALQDWRSVGALQAADGQTLGLAAGRIRALSPTATPQRIQRISIP